MKAQGFPKSSRLLNSHAFNPVFDHPDGRVSNRSFLVLAKQNTLCHGRLGVVVGKKAVAKANDRNRIKRLIRETFRCAEISTLSMDLVVLARKDVHQNDNALIKSQLLQLFGKLERA